MTGAVRARRVGGGRGEAPAARLCGAGRLSSEDVPDPAALDGSWASSLRMTGAVRARRVGGGRGEAAAARFCRRAMILRSRCDLNAVAADARMRGTEGLAWTAPERKPARVDRGGVCKGGKCNPFLDNML